MGDASFTLNQIVQIFLAFCGAIAAIGAATAVISRWWTKAHAPEVMQNGRIEALERRMLDVEMHLDRDNKRLLSAETGMRCIIKALVAVLNGTVHGNNKEQMEKALDELNDYLTTR